MSEFSVLHHVCLILADGLIDSEGDVCCVLMTGSGSPQVFLYILLIKELHINHGLIFSRCVSLLLC